VPRRRAAMGDDKLNFELLWPHRLH
jgi:hypothetical protein